MLRTLVLIRKIYTYFSQNKTWILSTLFVCSIIRESLWYALFGINILSYSTLQDLFINYANYFMSIIFMGFSYVLSLFIIGPIKSIKSNILLVLLFILFFFIFNQIFRMIVSFITFVYLIIVIFELYNKKKKAMLINNLLTILFLFTLLQPFEQYLHLRPNRIHNSNRPNIGNKFIEKAANYDNFSFEYSNMTIHTNSEQFYYIGGNSNYYFLLDKKQDSTMIIPKSECSNIKGTPMSLKKILERYS